MFGVGVVGVALVVASIWITLWLNAQNGKDTAAAINQMSSIANSMMAERPLVERQANAAADSAEAAKTTAGLAKGQTGAIIRQADALIGSANATIVAAGAQLASAQANTKTAEVGAKAASEQLRSATILAGTRVPYAKLVSVNVIASTTDPAKDKMTLILTPHISNAGGGTMLPRYTTFNFEIASSLPAKPFTEKQRTFGGNDISVAPGTDFSPIPGFSYDVSIRDYDAAKSGKKAMVVWGKIEYRDVAGAEYIACFVDTINHPEGSGAGAVNAINLPAYNCEQRRKN